MRAVSKVCPEPRAGHSAIIYKDLLVIFGGKNEENERLNDIWAFNFSTNTWEQYQTNQPHSEKLPLPRSGHSAQVH